MTTRTVTGTLKHLDGTAWTNAPVIFTLLDPYETSTTVFPAESHTETATTGAFSITLGVPDTGTAHYLIRLPDDTSHEIYLAAGATVDLVTLITISGTSVAQDDLQTLLDSYIARFPYNIVELSFYGGGPGKTAAVNNSAFTNAIAHLVSLGGGALYVPPGFTYVTQPVVLPADVSLIGSSMNKSCIDSIAVVDAVVQMVGNASDQRNGQRIENLWIYGNNQAVKGIELAYATYTNTFRNVIIQACTGAGFYATGQLADAPYTGGCWGNTLDNCRIYYCGRGVDLGRASNNFKILNSAISNNQGAGIYAGAGGAGIHIAGCAIETNGLGGTEQYGIYLKGCRSANISGCYFEANGYELTDGIDIYADSLDGQPCDGLTISGCYYNGVSDTKNAISIGDEEIAIVGGNSVYHTDKTIVIRGTGTANRTGFVSDDSAGII